MERITLASLDNAIGGTLLKPTVGFRSLVACIHGGGCHSGYFETGELSLAGALLDAGHAVLLVERPGTRGRPLLNQEQPLAPSVEPISNFIGQVWREHAGNVQVALVGHSIGGALALTIAANLPEWPLAAVLVSGIGDEPPPLVLTWPAGRDDAVWTDTANFFLGPEGTYDWRGLTRLRKVASPWNASERLEVVHHWPVRWRDVAPRVEVPVQLRLADGEKIWVTGEAVMQRMAAALTAAPEVDAAILPEGGHLYEFHKRGPHLVADQVRFLNRVLP
jgi:pimeloyl-ACP methyl ester carboxylesterase